MKSNLIRATLFVMVSSLFVFNFGGCVKESCTQTVTFKARIPVYMPFSALEKSVYSSPPMDLKTPGKIYLHNHILFINEYRKGVHVIDNTYPANPVNIAFINIPGNVDIAIKNNVMYADNYTDLVAINIQDPANVKVVSRLQRALKYQYEFHDYLYKPDPLKGIITGFTEKSITEKISCKEGERGTYKMADLELNANASFAHGAASGGGGSSSSGKFAGSGTAGSMAKFALKENYLYVIDQDIIQTFDVSGTSTPSHVNSIPGGNNLETIFPYNDHLFIGSQNGMHIFSITNPSKPSEVSTYEHITQCDPVVVKDDLAYVTLRSGNECGGWQNILEVVDISDLSNPKNLYRYEMTNPRGLGINKDDLFLCDGADGLKVYDIKDPSKINLNMKKHFTGLETFDVIPQQNIVLVIGPDGFYQYSYNETYELSFLSKISVVR